MKVENKDWFSEYELRQFIDIAVIYDIDTIYLHRDKNNPFGIFFNSYVNNARTNFEQFSAQLNKKLSESKHWEAIEMDLKQRFIPMITRYLEWYKDHENEIQKFKPYCPYSIMLSIIESTQSEILKYFPEKEKQ